MDAPKNVFGEQQESNISLPLEIILLVAEESDLQTAKSFSTTCKAVNQHLRNKIFKNISVEFSAEGVSKAALALSVDNIAPYIRKLAFEIPAEKDQSIGYIHEIPGHIGEREVPIPWSPEVTEISNSIQSIIKHCAGNLQSLEFRGRGPEKYISTELEFDIFDKVLSTIDLPSMTDLVLDLTDLEIEHECAWSDPNTFTAGQILLRNFARLRKINITSHNEMWYPVGRMLQVMVSGNPILRELHVINRGDYYTYLDNADLSHLNTLTCIRLRGIELWTYWKFSEVLKKSPSLTELDMQFCVITTWEESDIETHDTWEILFQACLELSKLRLLRLNCLHSGEGDRDWVEFDVTSGTPADWKALADLYDFVTQSGGVCCNAIETVLDMDTCGRKEHPR